jgi:hypothetical protein
MKVRQRWLALVLILCGGGGVLAQPADPGQCQVCPKGVNLYGAFSSKVVERLSVHRLPAGPSLPPLPIARDEPWYFGITFARNGAPCNVALIPLTATDDEHDPIATAIATALKGWRLSTIQVGGVPQCLHTKLFLYLRRTDGIRTLVVPGLDKVRK